MDRQTDRVLLFIRSNGEIARPEFWDAIEELAEAIALCCGARRRSEPELSHDQIRADGERISGPAAAKDSRRNHEALAFIDDQLSRCAMSVHLLGDRSGYIPFLPAGEPAKPITRLQLDRAEARCSADPSFRRFVWARQGLESTQEDQQSLIEGFQKGTALLPSDEFVTEPLELFKNAVFDHVRRRVLLRVRSNPEHPCPVLLLSRPADKPVLADLAAALHKAEYEAFLVDVDSIEEEDEKRIARLAAQVDAAIVLFTAEEETCVKRPSARCTGSPPRAMTADRPFAPSCSAADRATQRALSQPLLQSGSDLQRVLGRRARRATGPNRPGDAAMKHATAEHPFPGLRPFEFDDREFFFGREEQIKTQSCC